MASANAIPKSMGTNSLSADSGLRPMDSMALLAVLPIAQAGKIPPIAIVNALAKAFAESGSNAVIVNSFLFYSTMLILFFF